ncbi:hypothetical protein AM501_23910 [Aneurinibacillus migulanus]|uniref:hypothetical protein n=1 Tax=Aneurinibacillus migulanus TaxID=47500 RepID=UPI0005B8F661|nr:hypothetical protein [Aneurinibacillus migulanus]KIV58945.1 hypothetical protein TS64_04070 [Aneurinibacillus migulanus]KPD05823.1 hypothetical protein AM501_23910 [Aneurinibacillus migulanus]
MNMILTNATNTVKGARIWMKEKAAKLSNAAINIAVNLTVRKDKTKLILQNDRGLTLLEYIGVACVVIIVGVVGFIALGPVIMERINEVKDVVGKPSFGAGS